MPDHLTARAGPRAVPITPLAAGELDGWLEGQPGPVAAWARNTSFTAESGSLCLVPGPEGALERILAGVDPGEGPWGGAGLPSAVPHGVYKIDPPPPPRRATELALGWALGSYAFSRYKKDEPRFATLVWPKGADRAAVGRAAAATRLVRDLINTPAGDMGPAELAGAARQLARAHKARAISCSRRTIPRSTRSAGRAPGRRAWSTCAGAPRARGSPWSARAYVSIPAGSTSSRAAPCC